jgi:uncharacterized protein
LTGAADTLSETPASFEPRVESFDYLKREVMVPMRDGVKLQTLILIPRGAARAPMLLTRTPYGATNRISAGNSAHFSAFIGSTDVADDAVVSGGYIRVLQDIRGKHGSEGDYVMARPLQGPLNPTIAIHRPMWITFFSQNPATTRKPRSRYSTVVPQRVSSTCRSWKA